MQERNETIILRIINGETKRGLAREFGLSEPRICVITKGLPRPLNPHNKRRKDEVRERNEKIVSRMLSGARLAAAAKEFNISTERIRQIALRFGLPSARSLKRSRRDNELKRARQHDRELARAKRIEEREHLTAALTERVRGGMSIREAGMSLGLTRSKWETLSGKSNLGAITQFGRWRCTTDRQLSAVEQREGAFGIIDTADDPTRTSKPSDTE